MSELMPRMLIWMEGGIIQEISCDCVPGIEVVIMDSDLDGIDESEIMTVKDFGGGEEKYFKSAHPIRTYDPDPKIVEHYFQQVKEIAEEDGQQALDELVHEAMSEKAASINNQGREAQIEFLKSEGWTDKQIYEGILP